MASCRRAAVRAAVPMPSALPTGPRPEAPDRRIPAAEDPAAGGLVVDVDELDADLSGGGRNCGHIG